MKPIEYKGFEGHIILLCKGHYGKDIETSTIEALKMIWAIQCGYDYSKEDNTCMKSIADRLYKIIYPTIKDHVRFQEELHDSLLRYNTISSLTYEKLIDFYASEICIMQIREKLPNGKWKTLIKLPKPKKQLFNRILRGNSKYDDYKLINN